ncbi:MAG: hypothetical protein MRJ66_13955 [Nitrospira sp.]|nr:hypothetical protein [Nitrospira sp.]
MQEPVTITKGTCFALFAYAIGLSINLTDAERRVIAGTERGRLRHKARAPQYFEYRPTPLRLVQEGSVIGPSLVSQRFHLEAWDASILRKLQTLESIYGKMSDRAGTRRMEVLEWIIIILIALSIILSLLPLGKGH